MKLTDEQYWTEYWEKSGKKGLDRFLFQEVVNDIIPELKSNGSNMNYLEIGGAPGDVMVYFATRYGCKVSCVDFVAKNIIMEKMDDYGIENYEIFSEDFLTWESEKKYNIVASYGFIEHFSNYREIVKKHVQAAENEGYVIISMPNIRKANWLMYRLFNKKSLDGVNLEAIDLQGLQKLLKDEGCQILEARYWLTNFFMFNNEYPLLKKHKVIQRIFTAIQNVMIKTHTHNIPNSWFSPYMICIARVR